MSNARPPDAAARSGWLVWCLPLVLWSGVFAVASHAWRHGGFYDYGWCVPPVAVAMAWRRLRGSPAVGGASPGAFVRVLPAGGALLWWVLRVLLHVDPSWRMPQWAMAVMAVLATHAVASARVGRDAARGLLPVMAFALSAVPLPTVAEKLLIDRLTDVVVAAAALVCNLLGDPVRVVGDQMESMGRWVEVSDGCSGIRSMQGFLMVALFFGEWFRLGRFERVLLVPLSLGCVLLLNVARAVLLAWLGFHHGDGAVDRWHDHSGLAAFAAAAALVWWLALALERKPGPGGRRSSPAHRDPLPAPAACPTALGRLAAAGIAALFAAEAAAWWWMRPAAAADERVLVLDYPPAGSYARFDPDAYLRVRPALRCGNGWIAAADRGEGAGQLRVGWFEWDLSETTTVLEALKHSPDQCMGGVGWKLVEHGEARQLAIEGGGLGFDLTTFADQAGGATVRVFKSVWISGDVRAGLRDGIAGFGSALDVRKLRLAAAWHRFRPARARVLVAVVAGVNDTDAAWRLLQEELFPGLRFETRPARPATTTGLTASESNPS